MAPRTAKAKKATEVSEAPKKGRGKVKNVEEEDLKVEEQDTNEKVTVTVAEKKKRGKKAAGDTNSVEENGKTEDAPPAAKKGRKKNVDEVTEDTTQDKPELNGDQSDEEGMVVDGELENGDKKEKHNAPSRGRKKPTKKEVATKPEQQEPKLSRGRKAKQETETDNATETEEKPKAGGRGKGRKATPKADNKDEEDIREEDNEEEETKAEPPPTKGKKKPQAKPVKDKTPESDEQELDDKESQENEESSKKKVTKGRGKTQGKKALAKEVSEDKEDDAEEAPAKKRKINKKEDKPKDSNQEVDAEVPEPKPKGRGRGKKAVESVDKAVNEDDPQEGTEVTNKRGGKLADDKASSDDAKKPLKNKAATNYEQLDFSNTSKNSADTEWNFKIASWNVDGIRAWMNKGGLDYLTYEKPDILCLQETKCSKDKLPEELANVPGYHAYWECSEKDGYAGVGIYTSQLAMNVQYGLKNEELDNEGRIITAEYEQFYLICTYVPNAGKKLVTLPKRLQWNEEFRKFVKELDKKKPVIICGDMNVSHKEIDLTNPKTNRKNAGFTDEERAGMTELLGDGFVDTFRHLYPDKTGAYTFWTYMMNCRAKNVGWRLDYFIVSERILPAVCDNVIRDQVYGSDHCPISLYLHLKGADKPREF